MLIIDEQQFDLEILCKKVDNYPKNQGMAEN